MMICHFLDFQRNSGESARLRDASIYVDALHNTSNPYVIGPVVKGGKLSFSSNVAVLSRVFLKRWIKRPFQTGTKGG